MLDLFKEVAHLYNLRDSLICGSYKIKTVRYGTKTILPTFSKNLVNYSRRNKRICIIRKIPSKKSSYRNRIVAHVAFAKKYIANAGFVNLS